MWLLTNITTGNNLIVISEKSKYTVGRVGADLVITDDSSISRTHAFIHIKTSQINNEIKEILQLEDAGSKYGTFHNDGIAKGALVPKQQRITLVEGDRVRFGVFKSIWSVSNKTPFIAVSVLPTEHAIQLKQYIRVLGGCILSTWDEKCTHLTLGEISLSSKLLHAILDQKPIVTCDYWCNIVQAGRRGRRSLPKAEAYAPPNPENFDLKYREERKLVFNDLTFVFLHAHHFKKYAPIVEKAGGNSKHLNVGIQKSFLVRKDVVVIQYVPSTESQSSQTINTIEDYLKLHSRRSVPEFEIGLAILQCSIEKYCNPIFNGNVDLEHVSKSTESVASQNSVLASANLLLDGDETEVFIPETDNKSTASTYLTDKSPAGSGSAAFRTELTDLVTIESQTIDRELNHSEDGEMASLQVTESAQEANKRKRTRGNGLAAGTGNLKMDSEDDELFNFASKKAHLEKRDSPVQREIRKQSRRTVINMSGFLEKSQVPAINVSNTATTGKHPVPDKGSKRARIADIDNSDDDDLFCFGEKSHTNDDGTNAKRARFSNDGCDSDEDLFKFDGVDPDEQNNSRDDIDAGASKESGPKVIKTNQIAMPKPKPLPAKICITDWLDCSLSALNIKAEQMKYDVDAVKKEINDSGVETDSKDIEPIKGGCIVTVVSTKSLLHERDFSSNKSMTRNENNSNDYNQRIKNFKKFTKRFHRQNRRVIPTVSSTVCGTLI